MIIVSGVFSYAFSFFCFFDWFFWLSLSFSCCCGCSLRFAPFCAFWLPGFGWLRGWSRSLGSGVFFWVPLPAGLLGGFWALWLRALGLCPSFGGLRSFGCSRRSGLAGGPALFPGLPGGRLPGSALLWGRLRFLGFCGLCSWFGSAASALAPRPFGSPWLGWCRLGALAGLLVVGGSRSPPGSVISFLVLLYCSAFWVQAFFLDLSLKLCYNKSMKPNRSKAYGLPMHSNQRIYR
jgi:hypothetical protein